MKGKSTAASSSVGVACAGAENAGFAGKRVLVVSQHFWPEQFRINDIVSGFVDDGVTVDVLCGLPNYPKGEWFAGYRYTGPRRQRYLGAVEVFRAGELRRKGNTGLRIFLNYVSFPFFALFNLPRLAGRRYDAVFCYETSPVLMLLPAIVYAKTHRVPLVTYVLDLWPDNLYSVLPVQNKLLRRIASAVSNWHYRRGNRLIALSDGVAERLRVVTKKKRKPPSICVVPQYSEDFYAEDIADEALARRFAGHFNVLFAGNISPAQDLETLVDAVALLEQAGKASNLQVLLLGDGMSRAALEAYVGQKGVAHRFCFCGQVPSTDIPRWTGVADALFAGLSQSENLGLTVPAKLASYFAAARPVLASMDGAAAEAAMASGALMNPAGNAPLLADNMARLMAMPEAERQALGAAGRAHYRQHYSRSLLLRQLEACIFDAS